jgi:serine/threonine protein kinase
MEQRVGGKYLLKKKIGGGSFGDIYSGEDIETKEPVAFKLESIYQKPSQLANEKKLYTVLAGGCGIPEMKWYGKEIDYNILVMDYLGKSLEELFKENGRVFSLKCVLIIAIQLISRLEYIHRKGFLHRDVKPENFIIGEGKNSNIIYMIDYGISSRYINPKTQKHIEYREGKNISGTARYASINNHLGIEPSRRDDLESLAYILIYFLKGSLPWQSMQGKTKKEKYDSIMKKKMATKSEDLCAGIPREFKYFLDEVRKLNFTDTPHYSLYRSVFRDLFIREGFAYDCSLDLKSGGGFPFCKSFSNGLFDLYKNSQIKKTAYDIIVDPTKRNQKKKIIRPMTCKIPIPPK